MSLFLFHIALSACALQITIKTDGNIFVLLASWCMVEEIACLLNALGEKEHHSKSDLGASDVGDLASL